MARLSRWVLHDVLHGIYAHSLREGGKECLINCFQRLLIARFSIPTGYATLQEKSKVSKLVAQRNSATAHCSVHFKIVHIRNRRLLSHTLRLSQFSQVVGNLQEVLLHRPHRHLAHVNFMEALGR